MVRLHLTAGLFALTALYSSHAGVSLSSLLMLQALITSCTAPATRRQLGNLECNIDRGEIVFHVAQLGATISSLGNATGLVATLGPNFPANKSTALMSHLSQ